MHDAQSSVPVPATDSDSTALRCTALRCTASFMVMIHSQHTLPRQAGIFAVRGAALRLLRLPIMMPSTAVPLVISLAYVHSLPLYTGWRGSRRLQASC